MGHGLDAVDGGDGANEDSASFAKEMGGCVDAVVHAVDEVDVGSAGWAEEGEVVGGEAAVGVGGGVGEAEVGFDLGDAAGKTLAVEIADEELAEESSGYDLGRAGIEAPWEEFGEATSFLETAHIHCEAFLFSHPTFHPSTSRTDLAPEHLRLENSYGWTTGVL